jgi:hypothetical protein
VEIIKKQYFSSFCELSIELPTIAIRMIIWLYSQKHMWIQMPLIIHLQTCSESGQSTTKTMMGIWMSI